MRIFFYLDAYSQVAMVSEASINAPNFLEIEKEITEDEYERIKNGEQFRLDNGSISFVPPQKSELELLKEELAELKTLMGKK